MAPRLMPVRRQQTREIKKVLGEGTYTTTDPQGQINVMRQYQAANLIPTAFETPNQVSDAVSSEMAAGLSKEQALSKLGITLPRSFFDNKGKLIGRVFRDAQSPALIEAWNKATTGMPAEALGKLERSEWSNQQKVLQEVGRRLGMRLDLGHFETSASGAPGNIAAAGAEYNLANQAAGRSLENPFRPQTQPEVADIGMATNKVQGLAEASLLAQDLPTRGGLTGSPLNPYISVLLGTTLSGQKSRLLPKENLETLNYTFNQLEKQGANPVAMYDYIRERAGKGIDIDEMAKAGQSQYDISKFSPKAEALNAGPLKIVQPPIPKGPTVTTKGVPKGLAEPQVILTPSQLMPKTGQPIDPELVSQFSRQIGNRINRRLGKSPFDETLDTTSQKYLENIGKYQQFIDLDEASKAALGLYGENVKQYYADLNRQLRSGNTANLTPQQIAINEFLQENLTKAIDVLPSEQRDLYRAIKDPVREGLTNLKVGDVYTDKGFGSFSADEKAALRFIRKDAPSALITVQNAAGKNIGPVMEFDESEFLQKPGAQYRLESIDEVFSPKTGGTVPNYKFTQVTSQSLGQKAAAIANREPVKPPKPVVVQTKPAPVKPKPAVKPPVRTRVAPAATTTTKTRTKPTSASMQIRAMQNTAPDVIRIQPGMSMPSSSLIQGI